MPVLARDLDRMRVLQSIQLQGYDENIATELLPDLKLRVNPKTQISNSGWILNTDLKLRVDSKHRSQTKDVS